MKPDSIRVGKTYTNRGAERSRRTVIEISTTVKVNWYGHADKEPVGSAGVKFRTPTGYEGTLYLSSFAAWAGKEVE